MTSRSGKPARKFWREWLDATPAVDDLERAVLGAADDENGFIDFDALAGRLHVDEADLFDALDRCERDGLVVVKLDGFLLKRYGNRPPTRSVRGQLPYDPHLAARTARRAA